MSESVLVFVSGDCVSDSRLREIAQILARSPGTIYLLTASSKKRFQHYVKYFDRIEIYNRKDYFSPLEIKGDLRNFMSVWIFTESRDDFYDMRKVSILPRVHLSDSFELSQEGRA